MLQSFFFGLVLTLTPLAPISAQEQESVAEMVINDCKPELVNYCSEVEPGRGRIVACLYAHGSKLSNQCSLAIEIGVVQLNMILSAVSYVVDQCQVDLDKHCGDVEIGGGRMYQCMSKKRAELEPQCKAAFLQAEDDLK